MGCALRSGAEDRQLWAPRFLFPVGTELWASLRTTGTSAPRAEQKKAPPKEVKIGAEIGSACAEATQSTVD